VMIGRPLLQPLAEHALEESSQRGMVRFKSSKQTFDMLKSWIDPDKFEKLGLEDHIFNGNLEVWIEIRYPKYQRASQPDSIRLLDNLAIALRDIDESQARLQLSDGSIVHGKELKVSGTIEVESNKGLLNENDIYKQMRGWITTLIKNGVVAAD